LAIVFRIKCNNNQVCFVILHYRRLVYIDECV
jgi:hypothetical protein